MGKTGKAVTYDQIKKIYAAARERGMDNDLLHEHMEMLLHKPSIKELTKREAATLIDSLEGKTESRSRKERKTSKQMYFICGLMKELGWVTAEGEPDMARLNSFLQSDEAGFKLSDYRFLNIGTASDLIEALKAMAARKREKEVAGQEEAGYNDGVRQGDTGGSDA